MFIIPAIDLYQKKVVRLTKGDKSNCRVYGQDPFSAAKKWQEEGAKWLHLVDLSAAFSEGDNQEIITEILKETDLSVELGGGIRSLKKVEELISAGVDRLILGTAATDPKFLKEALETAGPEKIAVALDEKEGKVSIAGWQKNFAMPVIEYLDYLKNHKVKRVIYTDTSCDGTLEGPNLSRAKQFEKEKKLKFIFSGGISSLEDIINLKKTAFFAEGIIVGKALYEKRVSLKEAINSVS